MKGNARTAKVIVALFAFVTTDLKMCCSALSLTNVISKNASTKCGEELLNFKWV